MSVGKSDVSERRYSEICGATNNRGEPCKLPAGWGTPGSGGKRCKFHGGASTGPSDTSHLENNSYAEGNPGGGAPELNKNAATHGGSCDWKKTYERLEGEEKAFVDRIAADIRKQAREHAPDVDPDRRDRLAREHATLSLLYKRASLDQLKRGLVIEEEITIGGETYTHHKPNPTTERTLKISKRKRMIAKELRLWPGFQD